MDNHLPHNAKATMIALILFNLFAFSMIAKSQSALCAPVDERPASSTYSLTVNDGTDYNSAVPISGDWVANASYSQFIIPAGDLAVMKWGTISKMTFYPHQEFSNLDWGNAEFEVYMTETGQTTLSSLIDWSDMNMVRNSARLQIINGQMIVMLDSPYNYLGGNLLIGFKQTVPGTTNNCFWYGVDVLGASLGNNGPNIQQWNFLPKTTFDYDFVQMPECLPVTGLTSSDIDLYSANLSWTAGESGETAWKLQYQAHGATEWTTIDVHSTDLVGGVYPLTGLNSGTIYHWQVAAWCDTANEEAISPYAYGPDFITLCQAFTTLDENFDSYAPSLSNTDNSLPPCWNYINTSNDIYTPFISGYPSITNGQYHSASNKLEFRFFGYEGDASGEEIAILPLMESLDGMRIRFYATCSRKSDLIVGTMTDPTDASTFVALEDGMITDLPPSYGQYVLNLNSDNGNYIAFKMNAPEGTFSFNQIFVDDVVVEVIPPCGDAPTLNTATSDGAHGFEATFSPISTEQGEWIYAVTTTDDLPSTNIALQGNTTAPEGFGVQTGLESDTDYWLWVGYACDIDGKTYWSNSLPFHTEISCPPIVVDTLVPIPHGAILTWEGNSDYYDVYYREPEYINTSVGLFQGFENGLQGWTLRDCASETGIVSSANVHGGKYIFMFNWLSGDPQNLISPLLNEGTNGWFMFYYRQYSGGQATQTFRVGYSSTTNETDAFTFGDEITSSNEVEWLLFSEEMPAGTKYVCIQYTSNNYWFYIDDILVGAPTVPAGAWQLAGEGITANTYTINQPAITLETSYEAKVVGYCIVDNKTIESDVVGFTTDACSAPIAQVSNIHYYGADVEWNSYSDSYTVQYRETTFLFEEDFESEESFANWTFISENPENEGYAGRHVDAAYNRSYGFTFSSLASASNSKYDQYLISPELAVTGYLKFYFRKPYGANESLYVGVSTTTSDLNAFTWSGDLVPTQSWQQYVQELPADVKYIAFHYYGNNKFYVYIDGITITSEAATGDWMVINDAVSPYTLSDLIPGTGYEVKVHGICDGTNSDWSETLTFTTEVYTFSGSGTETAPYLIATTDDMDALAYMVNKGNNCSGLYFRMEADLYYSGKTYTPVGTSANRFQGHFDGDGHSISNVVINQPGQSYQGLFGTIGDNGTVKNLVLGAGSSITAKHYVGGITGWCFGTVTGCTVSEGVNITGDLYVGGIAGNSSYNPVTDNLNLGVVSGDGYTGGIVGSKPNNITSLSNNYYAGNCTVGGIGYSGSNSGNDVEGQAQRGYAIEPQHPLGISLEGSIGVFYDGKVYAGENQETIVGFEVTGSSIVPQCFTFSAGTYDDNGDGTYTITMPAEDITVSGNIVEQFGMFYEIHCNGDTTATLIHDDSYATIDAASVEDFEYQGTQYTVTEIADNAFDGCEHLKWFDCHSNILSIGDHAFRNCDSLKYLGLYHTDTPPTVGTGCFDGVGIDTLMLMVPFCSRYEYAIHPVWGQFGEIQPDGECQYNFIGMGSDQLWSTPENWAEGEVPVEGAQVGIMSDCEMDADVTVGSITIGAYYDEEYGCYEHLTVKDGATLTATSFIYNSGDARNFIIEDGAQVFHPNTGAQATVEKNITAYTPNSKNGWHLVSSPAIESFAPSVDNGFLTNNYDLYFYDEPAHYWRNYKPSGQYAGFSIEPLEGYLYANSANDILSLTGTLRPATETVDIPLSYTDGIELAGFNLVGNPFAHNVTTFTGSNIADEIYCMNDLRNELTVAYLTDNNPLKPGEGFFVKAMAEDASITFNDNGGAKGGAKALESVERPTITLEISQNGLLIDRLILKTEGAPLEKFTLNENGTKIYATEGGEEYAVAVVGRDVMHCVSTETPVNFKAAKNGTYTLTVNVENLDLDYLHLIDNLTGEDVDMLASPTYTFTAKTSDYVSRFRLVFSAAGASAGSASDAPFAYINNGNIIITADADGATLQIVDMLGRVVRTVGLSQCGSRTTTTGMPAGMYVLRLIAGDSVRTQKIVIP